MIIGKKKAEESVLCNNSRETHEAESQRHREDARGYIHNHHRAKQTREATWWDK